MATLGFVIRSVNCHISPTIWFLIDIEEAGVSAILRLLLGRQSGRHGPGRFRDKKSQQHNHIDMQIQRQKTPPAAANMQCHPAERGANGQRSGTRVAASVDIDTPI